jgi:hypothetical protein
MAVQLWTSIEAAADENNTADASYLTLGVDLSRPSCSSVITSHPALDIAIFDLASSLAVRQGTRPYAHHEPEGLHQQCPQHAHFSQLSAIRYLNTSHRTKIPSSAKSTGGLVSPT